MKKIKKIELLEKRLAELEIHHKKDAEMMSDLLDYLMRVDTNFINNPGTLESWYMRLTQLRNTEESHRNCAKAKQLLENNGYVVAEDENSIDAARMRKWTQSKMTAPEDDDIPF